MTDIHCHILPAFDDGSEDISESLAMARTAVESGVTCIVATPHFRGQREELASLNRLVARYRRLVQTLDRDGIPLTVLPGAEILCTPQTPELAREGALPTLGSSNYLLAEFFFDESLEFMDHMFSCFTENGYRVVIAHPERYEAVQEAPTTLVRWFRQGYVLQLNKGSLLGAFGPGPEQTAHWALEHGVAHIIASDAHSARRRTTEMAALRQYLLDICPEEYVRILLEENPVRLVNNQSIAPLATL